MEADHTLYRVRAADGVEMLPGLTGRFVHSEHNTIAYWSFEPDVAVPGHSHAHEQIVNVIEGTFELTVGGVKHLLEPGSVLVIPPNATHEGRSITRCLIIDVFYPVREDFR